jgi:hypothetical protein
MPSIPTMSDQVMQGPTNTADRECIIKDPDTNNLVCIKSSQLLLDPEVLENNSQLLANLAEDIELKFNGHCLRRQRIQDGCS